MRTLARVLWLGFLGLLALLASGAALLGYFVYTPDPEPPVLSGTLTKASIEVGGLKRSYLTYVPKGLAKGAPLVLVMHGSGESAMQIRKGTGYGFERLADAHGFAVVYPNSYASDWNDCSTIGEFSENGVVADDVGFLGALVDKLISEIAIDPGHVFATGVSAGGSMSIRLALEDPARFRAVAAVAANVPAPQSFKCKPAAQGTSVLIMNGTQDPLVPFDGGEVNLLGLFYKGGQVISSRASGQYFADWNHIAGAPETSRPTVTDGHGVEHWRWRNEGKKEVELAAMHGAGHGLPQPYSRRPRLLGPSPMSPNGPEMIWRFFQRQRP